MLALRVAGSMKIRIGTIAALAALALAVPVRAPAALPLAHIQPGAPLTDPTQFPDDTLPYSFHRCTMGFILADRTGALPANCSARLRANSQT